MFVLGVVIGIVIKKRKAKENEQAVQMNPLYGLEEYYEDTQIVDTNAYYEETSRTRSPPTTSGL